MDPLNFQMKDYTEQIFCCFLKTNQLIFPWVKSIVWKIQGKSRWKLLKYSPEVILERMILSVWKMLMGVSQRGRGNSENRLFQSL